MSGLSGDHGGFCTGMYLCSLLSSTIVARNNRKPCVPSSTFHGENAALRQFPFKALSRPGDADTVMPPSLNAPEPEPDPYPFRFRIT